MSHFNTGVICKELNDYEELLAPYQENNMGDCPKEYMQFTSTSKEEKEYYENGTTERFVTDDGKYLSTWDSCFEVRIDEEEYEQNKRFWEIIVENQPLKEGEEKPFNLFNKNYYLERYEDKNDYATQESIHKPYALITPDGKWYEKGEMGWFGCDDSTKETRKSFEDNFNEIVNKDEYQDYYFVLVDCHI